MSSGSEAAERVQKAAKSSQGKGGATAAKASRERVRKVPKTEEEKKEEEKDDVDLLSEGEEDEDGESDDDEEEVAGEMKIPALEEPPPAGVDEGILWLGRKTEGSIKYIAGIAQKTQEQVRFLGKQAKRVDKEIKELKESHKRNKEEAKQAAAEAAATAARDAVQELAAEVKSLKEKVEGGARGSGGGTGASGGGEARGMRGSRDLGPVGTRRVAVVSGFHYDTLKDVAQEEVRKLFGDKLGEENGEEEMFSGPRTTVVNVRFKDPEQAWKFIAHVNKASKEVLARVPGTKFERTQRIASYIEKDDKEAQHSTAMKAAARSCHLLRESWAV